MISMITLSLALNARSGVLSSNMRAPAVSMAGTLAGDFIASRSRIDPTTGSWPVVVPSKKMANVPSSDMLGTGSFVRWNEKSSETFDRAPITAEDVEACQAAWAGAIQSISKTYLDGGDYIKAASDAAGELYGYGHTNVLFKPTKAADEPFRPTGESAMSYFVGGAAVENGLEEDAGFAINGGKGWSKVVFDNHQVEYTGNIAIAMGCVRALAAALSNARPASYAMNVRCKLPDPAPDERGALMTRQDLLLHVCLHRRRDARRVHLRLQALRRRQAAHLPASLVGALQGVSDEHDEVRSHGGRASRDVSSAP